MEINIEWQKPILLAQRKSLTQREQILAFVEDKPGVYYFSRKFGPKCYPFYIGESLRIRSRLIQHFDNARMFCILTGTPGPRLQEIAQGSRQFHFGYLAGKQNKAKQCIRIVQKLLIEEAIAQKHILINTALTRIKQHEVNFNGNRRGRGVFSQLYAVEA